MRLTGPIGPTRCRNAGGAPQARQAERANQGRQMAQITSSLAARSQRTLPRGHADDASAVIASEINRSRHEWTGLEGGTEQGREPSITIPTAGDDRHENGVEAERLGEHRGGLVEVIGHG